MNQERFADRRDAGRQLGAYLLARRGWPQTVVLGLPRGGVPVAAEVAPLLGAPLDAFVVRKLGVPGRPELAMGAIAGGGIRVLNHEVLAHLRITDQQVARTERQERAELERRERLYRAGRPPLKMAGQTALLIDDGTATGATMQAAAQAVRLLDPAAVVIALPVAPPEVARRLGRWADEVISLWTPAHFYAVGQFYADFRQTTDQEVQACLR